MLEKRISGQADLVSWLVRNNVLFLGAGVVTIVCLIVLPVPRYVLDSFIAVNIAGSIGLLLITIFIGSPLMLSTFPTLLLFTTLLRLALNIASSRAILLNADAGHIIETFGRLVVGGNVIVGLVVFVIISIVQFVVVAKGSERVAEVAARFTLDAMPGKQMSIDADLRAGMVDKDEAKRRRRVLEQESQLNGAMDGAMKFVKGDAIAGLLIAFVNLVAGLAVGAGMNGMPFGEAVDRYTVLTVGDGMVSQIPSLFVSIAAGVLTTRVSGNETGNLGAEIMRQVLGQPTALLVTGAVLFGFLLVPGFPVPQFLLLGMLVGGAGLLLFRQAKSNRSGQNTPVPAMQGEGTLVLPPALVEDDMPALAVPLLIRVSDAVSESMDPDKFGNALSQLRDELRQALGLPFPGVRLVGDSKLDGGVYRILVHDVPVIEARMQVGKRVAVFPLDVPIPNGLELDPALSPLGRIAWLNDADSFPKHAHELSHDELLVRYLGLVLFTRPHEFLGMQEVQRLLQRAETDLSDLMKELTKVVPLQRITDVLRRLLQEGVPIRNLRAIAEGLLNWGPREKDIVILTELVRIELGRWIAGRYTGADRKILALLVHPDTEATFKKSIQQNSGGSFLALTQEDRKRFCGAAETLVKSETTDGKKAVVVTTMDLRRYTRKLVEAVLPDLVVLSYEEIGSHAELSVCGTISL